MIPPAQRIASPFDEPAAGLSARRARVTRDFTWWAIAGVAIVSTAVLVLAVFADGDPWLFAGALVVGVAAASAAAVFLGRSLLRRLDDLAAVVAALAAGDFGARASVDDSEFGRLASRLNGAMERTAALIGALRHERAQLEALLNASSDATVAIDTAGVVTYVNDAARSLLTLESGDGAGRPFIHVVRDHEINDLLMASARRGERSVRVIAFSREQRWLQATAVPIEGAGGWAALAVFHDLTEVRRLDSVRRDFISNVSHELRTPLAGIRAAAETLDEGAIEDAPAAREFLGHILHETDRMTQLVEELLELSRIESGAAPMRFTTLDAAALGDAVVRRFAAQAERAGVMLRAQTPDTGLSIIGDDERLERALGNLVANAIKFTPAGGSVTVSVAPADDQSVAISVADTGIGIEPDDRERVFERFYKTDRGRAGGGTGLGLAIVKHIVQAHEGAVSVESVPGRGATFVVRVPRQ